MFAELAAATLGAPPNSIEKLLNVVEKQGVVRDEPELEVAPPGALGAKSGAGPVRAAQIEKCSVDDDGFQVNAGTKAHFEAARSLPELGLSGELLAKRAGRR